MKPIITPRFAVSLDMKTMKKLAEIAKEYNLNIQVRCSFHCDLSVFVLTLFLDPHFGKQRRNTTRK